MTIIKSAEEIAVMREAGRIVAIVLQRMSEAVKPGIKTRQLNDLAEKELGRWKGAKASFKGYNGFPASICASVNDEIVHGIPDGRALAEGDIVSLDFGVIYKGFQGDAALTVGVGQVGPEAARLLEVAQASLVQGIAAAHEGGTLGILGQPFRATWSRGVTAWSGNIPGMGSAETCTRTRWSPTSAAKARASS